jgi:hypothetical protein
MVTFRSNVAQAGQAFFDDLGRQVEAATHRAMTKTGLVGEARVKGIVERESYDTGRLLRSVKATIYRSPEAMRLVIGTNLDYAIQVEEGRKAGKWPNLDALTKWVGRKLRREGLNTRVNVTFDELKAMARTGGRPATEQQKAYRTHLSVLYMVGRKIATKGIREKYIFKRIESGLLAYFRNELNKELATLR